jgi:hypothetical protein
MITPAAALQVEPSEFCHVLGAREQAAEALFAPRWQAEPGHLVDPQRFEEPRAEVLAQPPRTAPDRSCDALLHNQQIRRWAILRGMAGRDLDPLLLGQRVVAILERGQRTATYKLATLMALIDHSVENAPERGYEALEVPLPILSHRVLDLYWRQVRPFEGVALRQSTQARARIPQAALDLRGASRIGAGGASLDLAASRAPQAYDQAIDEVVVCLARQPLHRLQRLPGSSNSDCFLYEDAIFHENVSRRALRLHGDRIVLKPGVATGLARLAGLLKPALEIMWVEDVRRLNRFLDQKVPDVAGHLFGRDRIAMGPVRNALKETFGATCFYCQRRLPIDNPVDHVLPWSILGINGLANLVLSCAGCNGDKRHSLPAPSIVDQVLARDRNMLEGIAATLEWPTEYERVVAAARGIYRSQPRGSNTWAGVGATSRLEWSVSHWWLTVDPQALRSD